MFQLHLSELLGLVQNAGVDEESTDDEEKEEDLHSLKLVSNLFRIVYKDNKKKTECENCCPQLTYILLHSRPNDLDLLSTSGIIGREQ